MRMARRHTGMVWKRVDDIRRDAMNRPNWKKYVDRAVNTNGQWAQGD